MKDITGIIVRTTLPDGTSPIVGDICKGPLGYFKWSKSLENADLFNVVPEFKKLQIIEITIAVKFSDLPALFQEFPVTCVYNFFDDKLVYTNDFVKHTELQGRLVYSSRAEKYLNCENLNNTYIDTLIDSLNNKEKINIIKFVHDYFTKYYNKENVEVESLKLHETIKQDIISKIEESVKLTLRNIIKTSLIDVEDPGFTLEYHKQVWLNQWIEKNI